MEIRFDVQDLVSGLEAIVFIQFSDNIKNTCPRVGEMVEEGKTFIAQVYSVNKENINAKVM